jgi:DNA adenine methylase
MKPPIPRMGGKSRLRKTIISKLPEHTCYVEPFFGAGWVYFGKEPSKVEVINDIDKELINMFRMIKHHAPEIERMLEYEFSGRDMFEEYKRCTVEYLTEIQRAVRFLYLISQSFASQGGTYGYGTNTRPSPQIFYKGVLGDIKERLRNTYIENKSFDDIITRYDRAHTFFFCDPPYYETAGYENTFDEADHLLLRETLSHIKGKFLVTINDHLQVREWYKDFKIEEVKVAYSVAKEQKARKEYGELIITNY